MNIRAFFIGFAAAIALTWTPALWAQVPPSDDGVISEPRSLSPEAIAEEAAQAEWKARYDTLVSLRLSDELAPEQRAAVSAVIDTLPGVRVAKGATHEIVPHPVLADVLVLVETPGGGLVARESLWSPLTGERNFTVEELFRLFSGEGDKNWGSNLTPPLEIGDIEDPFFSDQLRTQLLTIARHSALLRLAAGNSFSKISLCLANEPPPSGFCPLPEGGIRWNQAWHNEPIYISVERGDSSADIFTILAVSREGELLPLATGQGARYVLPSTQFIGEGAPTDQPADKVQLYFSPEFTFNDRLLPGHYDLIVIAAEKPVPPELWSMPLTGVVDQEACPPDFKFGLCYAMQGQRREALWVNGVNDIHLSSIGIRVPEKSVDRIRRGSTASKSVSVWQAQLVRYRPIRGRDSRGRGVVNFRQSHKCGGAYIGDGFVLTAAHCIPNDTSEMRVRLGTRNIRTGGRAFKVRSLAVHKNGMSRSGRVDLALLQLKATQASLDALGDDLQAIVPSGDPNASFNALSGLTVTGWGFQKARLPGETGWLAADGTEQTNPDLLEQLLMEQASMEECTNRPEYRAYRAKDMLCLRSRVDGGSSCAGDSGGPVTSRMDGTRRLVGIVSSGIGCAYRDLPAVYVNVAEHLDWIAKAKRKILSSDPGFYRLD